ncbi:MBL fold metallo-hydrolase [Balneatrix alpica]|uniref:MBL fold metallo-hydrolase n=1 Tax=Balneatrix alpica TaxID=75684 RepID=UPI00273921BB|nr:MBL fold metallo-hydrolase [Balneatrix alpica]
MTAQIQPFFDPATWTYTYVVSAGPGSQAAIIDSVLNYDAKSGRTRTESADEVIAYVQQQQLQVQWILETHAHADHLSAAAYLQQKLGGTIAIGARITQVQGVFKQVFNLEPEFQLDGSQFGYLFADHEVFMIGELQARAIPVPGHTPADMAYQIGNGVFVGDTLFMPDVGTARCDFPGGDAGTLYRSIQSLLNLPEQTELYMCHDYPPEGREPQWKSTVAEQKRFNVHVHEGVDEASFVAMRQARDATLEMPMLILPSIQINIRAGQLPPLEDDGHAYLKIPLNKL